MNCIQAQAVLAAYRELKNGEVDILELEVHLEECASCRQVLARYLSAGEQVRSLPWIEPLPEMRTNLMRTLAKEQLLQIQRSAPGTVYTPEFLKPYLQEHALSSHVPDSIATFSTAETGPLPVIHAKRGRRHSNSHMSQFAILGLAAMFLMIVMMGGITSLLLLAHSNLQGARTSRIATSLQQPSEITQVAKYTPGTLYQHVVSAVADNNSIYYTAYGDGANSGWMLEQLNRTTRESTPLLAKAGSGPLIVLGSAHGWLVWLEYDNTTSAVLKSLPHDGSPYSNFRFWSLHYLAVSPQSAVASGKAGETGILLKGLFNRNIAPGWVTGPVQDIWFVQDTLLVAMIDDNGISHLLSYDLSNYGSKASSSVKEIAVAPADHVFASPTATSDGSQVYWAEEWVSKDGIFHSNIWIQQVLDTQAYVLGHNQGDTIKVKNLFLSDGMSFRPQVVDDALFLLSTANVTNTNKPSTITPSDTVTIPRFDMSISTAPLDYSVQGTLLMIPLDGDSAGIPTILGTSGQASALQAGTNFVLWQDNTGYKMYDVQNPSDVTVGETLDKASFVAVNADTAVWTVETQTTTPGGTSSLSTTLLAFEWAR